MKSKILLFLKVIWLSFGVSILAFYHDKNILLYAPIIFIMLAVITFYHKKNNQPYFFVVIGIMIVVSFWGMYFGLNIYLGYSLLMTSLLLALWRDELLKNK
jgi:hypothetical protein